MQVTCNETFVVVLNFVYLSTCINIFFTKTLLLLLLSNKVKVKPHEFEPNLVM